MNTFKLIVINVLVFCYGLAWADPMTLATPVPPNAIAVLTFTPPGDWKIAKTTQKPGMRTTRYIKDIRHQPPQFLSEIKLNKEMGKDPAVIVAEMSNNIKNKAITENCEVEDAKQIPQTDKRFMLWKQAFQCKNSKSSVVQLYINADPKQLYLFTYSNQVYPFTNDMRAIADQLLKSSIQVCYKGSPCIPITVS